MDNQHVVKPKKRRLWELLKASMDKASSGCGPGCGCHAEKPSGRGQQKGTPPSSGSDTEKT